MEDQNQQQTPPEVPVSEQSPVSPAPAEPSKGSSKKGLIIAVVVLLLLAAGAAAYFLLKKDDSKANDTADTTQSQQPAANEGDQSQLADIDCEDGLSIFADKEFGAAFCYPSDWGTATVTDAKLQDSDTGYRQKIVFSANQQFIVGGVSEDWTTTTGRGGMCLDPSNRPPELSDYNVEWHDVTEGFAKRSIETTTGGYDMTEVVGDYDNGVCAFGHKVIDGSRYRVVSASYYNEFTTGVANAADHMEDPYVLFRETERFNLDKVLSTLKAY